MIDCTNLVHIKVVWMLPLVIFRSAPLASPGWLVCFKPDALSQRSQAILVYDVANRASFEELEQWLAEAASFGAGGIPMALCANKVCYVWDPQVCGSFRCPKETFPT